MNPYVFIILISMRFVCLLSVFSSFYTFSVYLRRLLSLPDDSGTNSSPKSESPFFLLGKVVMQQSYVSALIAMMVTIRISFCSFFGLFYIFSKNIATPYQNALHFESILFLIVVSMLFRSGASRTTAG